MDDIRDTRPWFWILIAILFAIAVVGLIIAISANNSSVNEKKIVKEATAEVEGEVAGLHGAIAAANEFQEESDQLANQDRARIRRAVSTEVSGVNKKIKKLNNRVAALETGQDEVKGDTAQLRKEVVSLTQDVEGLEEEASALTRKIRQLNANGGT
jgi:peptidoglycan hydrolase CwlO-like protein